MTMLLTEEKPHHRNSQGGNSSNAGRPSNGQGEAERAHDQGAWNEVPVDMSRAFDQEDYKDTGAEQFPKVQGDGGKSLPFSTQPWEES